jgi:acyl carrier protein
MTEDIKSAESQEEVREKIPTELILLKVKQSIVSALGIEEDEFTLDASLIDDLGAESLDFLDIAFRLEREFGIKIPKRNILERAAEQYGEELFVKEGILTKEGAALLRTAMPEADATRIKEGLTEEDVGSLFTPRTWVRLVETILHEIPEQCPNCGSDSIVILDHTKFTCEGCKERVYPPPGEEVFMKYLPLIKESALDS